jgi:hypothetical protein
MSQTELHFLPLVRARVWPNFEARAPPARNSHPQLYYIVPSAASKSGEPGEMRSGFILQLPLHTLAHSFRMPHAALCRPTHCCVRVYSWHCVISMISGSRGPRGAATGYLFVRAWAQRTWNSILVREKKVARFFLKGFL